MFAKRGLGLVSRTSKKMCGHSPGCDEVDSCFATGADTMIDIVIFTMSIIISIYG